MSALYTIQPKEPQKPGDASSRDNYQVTHTSTIFLVDPQGRLYGRFPPPQLPQEIAEVFIKIHMFYNERVKSDEVFSEDINCTGARICCLNASADGMDIKIHDPWVLAAPPNAKTLAAYLELKTTAKSHEYSLMYPARFRSGWNSSDCHAWKHGPHGTSEGIDHSSSCLGGVKAGRLAFNVDGCKKAAP